MSFAKGGGDSLASVCEAGGASRAGPAEPAGSLVSTRVHLPSGSWRVLHRGYCQLRAPLALNKKDTGMKHKESEMETMTKDVMKDRTKLYAYKEKKYTYKMKKLNGAEGKQQLSTAIRFLPKKKKIHLCIN